MKWLLITVAAFTSFDLGSLWAQTCPNDTPQIDVRVTWVCPYVLPTSAGLSCTSQLNDSEVVDALTANNGFLPVCLKLQGKVSVDMTQPKISNGFSEADRQNILKNRGSKQWTILDLFVVKAFAGKGTKDDPLTFRTSGVAGNAYSVRSARNKTVFATICLSNDGIVIARDSLNNRKHTLAHEVGHWLGLLHVFESCEDAGDDISDTVPESISDMKLQTTGNSDPDPNAIATLTDDNDCTMMKLLVFLKALDRTSCGAQFDQSILYNMENYTACRNQFSPEQKRVMLDAWKQRINLQAQSPIPKCTKK